ncbi:MAG: hypothetical protein LBH09_07205 [Peptococcaceae bacterium]|jgi:hypothetical protein|nr:hypothetical protein [Peptococcaceae bacterium]
MTERADRDARYIAAMEELTQTIRRVTEEYLEEDRDPEFRSQRLRFQQLEEMVASERRLIEEISPPCRLILEHFSTFLDQPDRGIGIRYGQSRYSNGDYLGYSINEWGHVTLKVGNCCVTWRDDEYQYMFYSDKVVLRAYDIQKPEISISFTFSLKYSKLLEEFPDVPVHPQTAYYQPDLFA